MQTPATGDTTRVRRTTIGPGARAVLEWSAVTGQPLMNAPDRPGQGEWYSHAFDFEWLELVRGKDVVRGVTALGLMSKRSKRFPFSRFPDLEHVAILRPQREQIAELAHLPKLTSLHLDGCRFTDLSLVAPLTALRHLTLRHAEISSVHGFEDLPDLRVFSLEGASKPLELPAFGRAASSLRGFTLRRLLPGNKVSLPTLESARALGQVKYLDLRVPVLDGSLAPLHGLKQLEHLAIHRKFSRAEILALRAALPHAEAQFQTDPDE